MTNKNASKTSGKSVRDHLAHFILRLKRATGLVEAGPSDAEVEAAVVTALLADPLTFQAIIDVEVHEGILTLSGVVESAQARRRALSLARSLPGVKGVVNRLTVDSDEAMPISLSGLVSA